jgi:hypothetical protein
LQDDAVGDRAKAAVRRRVRLRQKGVGVLDIDQRTRARCHRASVPVVRLRRP